MTELAGLTAVVTGAGSGIGLATAQTFAAGGARVFGLDLNAGAMDGIAEWIPCDVGSTESVASAFATISSRVTAIDILVNNAGIGAYGGIDTVSEEDYDRAFAVNTRSLFFLTRKALRLMPDGGRIINTGSGVTRIAFPEGIAYAMTKGAVDAFTLALAAELGPRQITVNTVAPGIIDTDVNASWLRGNAEANAAAAARAALGRVGEPEDVTGPVLFLASKAGQWTTGQVIDATGGSHL